VLAVTESWLQEDGDDGVMESKTLYTNQGT
jgi:hypothetical protein